MSNWHLRQSGRMNLDKLWIVNVGHGNCSVLECAAGSVIIDLPLREPLLEFLLARGVKEIEAVLISHADADHVGGLVNLLTAMEFQVRHVFLNPDQLRSTGVWRGLLV